MAAPPHDTAPHIELRVRGDFVAWLAAAGGTLAVTTYNSGKLAMFAAPAGRLEMRIWKLARPMGLAYDQGRLAVATRDEIREWRWAGRSEATSLQSFAPAAIHVTGRLDAHELAYDAGGLCFANTRFNCIARPSDRARFRRAWTPWFFRERVSRDACHLNGLGLRGGRVQLATAFCLGCAAGDWRKVNRLVTGVVLDVRRNRCVRSGLCMPHSPRWDGRNWWLCNSGEGQLCRLNPRTSEIRIVAELPGFTRGLCFAAGRAVVGLSRIRKEHILDAPPVRERFTRLRSGVWLVDPASGRSTGALEFVRGGREVFDVAFLPVSPRPELGL
jgi:uncharacterized protein (TIGR03032 family)